jgi:hypothetical protein
LTPGPGNLTASPAQSRRDEALDPVEQVRVVVDAKPVRNRQEQSVSSRDRLVLGKIGDQPVPLAGVRLAEPGSAPVKPADVVPR